MKAIPLSRYHTGWTRLRDGSTGKRSEGIPNIFSKEELMKCTMMGWFLLQLFYSINDLNDQVEMPLKIDTCTTDVYRCKILTRN